MEKAIAAQCGINAPEFKHDPNMVPPVSSIFFSRNLEKTTLEFLKKSCKKYFLHTDDG